MSDRAASTLKDFGPTLNPDGTLRAVSPSQVETFLSCNLKWFFAKKEKLPTKPSGKGAKLGDECHGRIEKFWNTGRDVRGPLELMGAEMLAPYLPHAPFNKGAGVAEAKLLEPRLVTHGGILITGYEDLHIPPHAGDSWPTIIDHKFKKDLDKWAPDAEELKQDTQAIIYGAHALAKYPNAGGYVFRHHNHQTEGDGGRYPLPVEIRVPRAEGWDRWLKLAAIIDGPMTEAARQAVVGNGQTPRVAFNIGACKNFGGCDFEKVCKHSPQNRFISGLRTPTPLVSTSQVTETSNEKGNVTMGLIAQHQAAQSTPSAPAAVPAQTNSLPILTKNLVVSPKVVQAKDCKQGQMYKTFSGKARFLGMLGSRAFFEMSDGSNTEQKPTDPVEDLSEDTAAAEVFNRDQAGVVAVAGALGPAHQAEVKAALEPAAQLSAAKQEKARKLGIVDLSTPDNPIAPPTTQHAGNLAEAEAIKAQTAPAQAVVNVQAPAQVQVAAETPVPEVTVAVAEAVPAPRRGRPPKAAQAQPAPVQVAQVAEPSEPANGNLMLLVNASCPQAKDLSTYVSDVCAKVAAAYSVPDVRLGHKQSDLGFGGWKALIALEALKNPPTGFCAITSSELADPIIEALVPMAKIVVRGAVR